MRGIELRLAPALHLARLLTCLLVLVLSLASHAFSAEPAPKLPAKLMLPVQVHFSMQVLNIARISETDKTADADLEYTLQWNDPTQAFDPVAKGFSRIDRIEAEAEAAIATMWTPGAVLENQIGEPRSQTVALSVRANGDVRLIRRLSGTFRITVDLSPFPFDSQRASFLFSMPSTSANDAIFVMSNEDRALSSLTRTVSDSNWAPTALNFTMSRFYGWNSMPYVRMTANATLQRHWAQYVLRVFVPFFAVMSVALLIFWSPPGLNWDRMSMTYSALLALAALSFTFDSSYPGSMSVSSPLALIISIGYLYIIAALALYLIVQHGYFPGQKTYAHLGAEIIRSVRVVLPTIFLIVCISIILRALV